MDVLFREVKFLLRTEFIELKVIYVARGCNKPADELAALCVVGLTNDHQVWMDQVPVSISRALHGDLSFKFNRMTLFHVKKMMKWKDDE